MIIAKEVINALQKDIFTWYEQHKRDLPWRKTRDPYRILVSEVMLQQTQVSRVIPKYLAWMEKFPSLESLAQASSRDVLGVWSGLGYNRRALYLQKAAQQILTDGNGFPQTERELRSLPGIGEYTARAVLCFGFDKQVAVVDTNVRKVILLKFQQNHPDPARQEKDPLGFLANARNDKLIQQIADQLLPVGRAYEWNQALMDYASAVLAKEKIPIKKQSTFKGSNRYYRGQIVKKLIADGKWHIDDLRRDFDVNEEKAEEIIAGLLKDRVITRKGSLIKLP